jgi:hypothetical protein
MASKSNVTTDELNLETLPVEKFAAPAPVQLSDDHAEILEAFTIAFSELGTMSGKVVKALEDKKITAQEGFSILSSTPSLLAAVPALLSHVRQWVYLNEDEQQGVVNAFALRFDITNDEAETRIEELIHSAVTIGRAIDVIVRELGKFRKKAAKIVVAA